MNAPAWSDAYYYLQAFVPHVIYDEEAKHTRYVQNLEEGISVGAEYAIWIKYKPGDVDEYNRLGTLTTDTPLYAVWKLDKSKVQDQSQ